MFIVADWSRVTTTREYQAGALGADGNGNVYKYVQYAEGAAVVNGTAGYAACYHTLDGYKDVEVTCSFANSIRIGAGILQADMVDGEWGWIQVTGPATLTIAYNANVDDGDPLTASAAANGSLAQPTLVTHVVIGTAGDASDNEVICNFPW